MGRADETIRVGVMGAPLMHKAVTTTVSPLYDPGQD
jgi:hypothetical protein